MSNARAAWLKQQAESIIAAVWFAAGGRVDVTENVKRQVLLGKIVTASTSWLGEPAHGEIKILEIHVRDGDARRIWKIPEYDVLPEQLFYPPSEHTEPAPARITSPAVTLDQSGAFVNGKAKTLNVAQRDVIGALIKARPYGLTKDRIESVRTDARGILTRLRKDADWAEVIHMAEMTSGRYRID